MNTVAIELMTMSSDPQYVSSSGSTSACLADAEMAARCGGNSDALFDLAGDQIDTTMLSDVEKRTYKNGACNYTTWLGTLDVPEGMVVVQKKRLDISTQNTVSYHAWIVKPESLRGLYERRAEEYTKLAKAL